MVLLTQKIKEKFYSPNTEILAKPEGMIEFVASLIPC